MHYLCSSDQIVCQTFFERAESFSFLFAIWHLLAISSRFVICIIIKTNLIDNIFKIWFPPTKRNRRKVETLWKFNDSKICEITFLWKKSLQFEKSFVQWRTFMNRNKKAEAKTFCRWKYYSNIYEQNSSHVLQIIEMFFLLSCGTVFMHFSCQIDISDINIFFLLFRPTKQVHRIGW